MSIDSDTFIALEAQALRERCAAAGLDYANVVTRLYLPLAIEGLARVNRQRAEREAPFDAILERARGRLLAGDLRTYEALSLEWLEARHGVRPHDVVELGGWSTPRRIRLERFSVAFGVTSDDIQRCLPNNVTLHFEGPSLTRATRARHHLQSPDSYVRKLETAS